MLLRLRRIRVEMNKGTPPAESLKMLTQMISDQQVCDRAETTLPREDAAILGARLA